MIFKIFAAVLAQLVVIYVGDGPPWAGTLAFYIVFFGNLPGEKK